MKAQGLRLGLMAAGGMALVAGAALAASPGQPGLARYDASIAPFNSRVQVVGEASPQAPVHFQVALHLRNGDALTDSNHAGAVLTYAQLEAAHLPTAQDYDRVLSWLKAAGFTIDATSPERLAVHASGTAGQVSKVMGVHFSNIVAEGKSLVSADTAPQIPAQLSSVIQSINGLQPEHHVRKLNRVSPKAGVNATRPSGYFASDFVDAYLASGITNGGEGSTTAIVIDTFPLKTDLKEYWTLTKTPQVLSNITFVRAVPGVQDAPSGEESMDTEITSSIAPKSHVRVYGSKDLTDANLDTTFQKIISDMHAGVRIDQVSISLGECETDAAPAQAQTDDNYFSVITSLGASIYVSSGDSGSLGCDGSTVNVPSFYSTSPNVTAVGGTSLVIDDTKSDPYTETSWDGSGGGISRQFKRPHYQVGLGYHRRVVPDVAADADPNTGAMVILAGAPIQVGGTSLSAPIWAGLTALANSDRAAKGKGGIGLLNRYVYPLGNTTNFRDITVGDNGGYQAGPGYDLVTGVGAPLMNELGPKLVKKK